MEIKIREQKVIREVDMVELPTIDLHLDENIIVKKLMEMITTVGFFHLTNIDGYDEDKHLEAVKAFHAIPEEIKHKLKWKNHNPENSNIYRGLAPFVDNDPSHKELYDMGQDRETIREEERKYCLYEQTPFPEGDEYKPILQQFRAHFKLMYDLGLKLLEYIAVGLGKDRNLFFSWWENESLSTFRSIYYLPRGQTNAKSDKLNEYSLKLTTPPHCDSGFITLLTTFMYPGLQVLIDGQYRSIKPVHNCIVVNLGETFERITNFKLKATSHQVLDIGVKRYSSPFFLEPKYSAIIPANLIDPNEKEKEKPIIYGPWLIRALARKYAEWKGFLEIVGLCTDE